jgi:hypothetical protein
MTKIDQNIDFQEKLVKINRQQIFVCIILWSITEQMEVLVCNQQLCPPPWRRGLVVSFPPATEETLTMGLEIESRQGKGW